MEKLWLKHYPSQVPHEIDSHFDYAIPEAYEPIFEKYAALPAFYNHGTTLTYAEIQKFSVAFAAYLQNELHLKKGDRFGIMLPNCLQYPIALFGALKAGLVVVNINPLYTSDELSFQLKDSGAKAILVLSHFAATVAESLTRPNSVEEVIVTDYGDCFPFLKRWMTTLALKYIYRKIPSTRLPARSFRKALAIGKKAILNPPVLSGADIAFLQYTGGTTGVAKGAVLTHKNILSNVMQAQAWFSGLLYESKEVIVTALPLYHIFSLTANCFFMMKIGGFNLLVTNPRDLDFFIKDISQFKFTAFTGVNTLFNALMKHPQFKKLDFNGVRLVLGGGMAVQKAVADQWQIKTGVPIAEAYGLTEASPCVTLNYPNLRAYNGSVGLPVPSTDVAFLDDQHRPLPLGEVGELAVKGPQVMKEYWNRPDETAKVFTQDGWLLTGDMARIDEFGEVHILERKKDMILVSGFNVYPNEVEAALAAMPGIREVGVIGVPDENSGEVPKAFIVKEADATLTEAQVIQFAKKHLTGYKVPKHIAFVLELPKTNVGKILRRDLKKL